MELLLLLIVLTIITLVGLGMWVVIRTLLRLLSLDGNTAKGDRPATRIFDTANQSPNDLDVTERQIVRFYRDGKLSDETYERLMNCIRAERANASPQPVRAPSTSPVSPPVTIPKPIETATPPLEPPPSVTASFADSVSETIPEPAPSFINNNGHESEPRREQFTPPPRTRRSFSEVLNAFMEESNIRWGEIIGGLLIIGCSTALVVSLWAQISEIPVLKFLIFTTVTAILFGIGLYTEHRWKLPTTSRGILTIATLLVPLNFLAIAAVSASNSSGALVIGSELIAPAIFLCLVYFAGRVITPGCAHVLSAGVLGSSIGQLLVRHFAATDASPALLVLLGAFPVVCYVATVGIALRIVLDDREIDEKEVSTVFTMLGTMSFAALLPFGLLLYKSGPLPMSMMYLAPMVTLWGLPMLATGTILWRKINNKELVAARTTGTALGLLGVCIVLAGMILAWPNPASIVPAALLNFAVFTALAIALRLPVAHVIAATCFALAYLVTGHVLVGNITWQNLRVMSLLQVSLSVGSGEALVGAFALFVIASEWLSQRKREQDCRYYLISACLVAVVSLALATFFGLLDQYPYIWIVYAVYSLGAFWIAWRHKLEAFTWAGSALLLFSLAHNFSYLPFSFPWQTALFAHATICAIAAIVSSRYQRGEALSAPLDYSALISIVLGVVALFQANTWEVTWMQAQRVFWISGILLVLLWLNRRRLVLNAFQIALLCALILTVKATLQQYEWYAYLPHAFMHPIGLQIQGTVLALFCLAWVAARLLTRRFSPKQVDAKDSWLGAASRLLDTNYSPDRFVIWLLLGAFLLLAFYGTLSGMTRELSALGSDYRGFNIAGFPHQEALALGSWIVLGLLLLTLLMSFWERRRNAYLLGAIAVLAAIIPLLAGQFENQIATATAWRWLAAIFLLVGSLAIWWRNALSRRLATYGWPELEPTLAKQARTLLIALTVVPLLALTFYPALRAIYYLPVQAPVSGFFAWFDDTSRYGFPLVLVALVMIGYSLRERMPQFAFYAGLLFNTTVTLAFLLAVVTGKGSMDRVVLVRLAQLNAMTLAVYLLPWLSTRGRWQAALSQSNERLTDFLLKLQLALAVLLSVVLFLPVVINLIWVPGAAGIGTVATGTVLGWLTFFSIVVAAIWLAGTRKIRLSAHALGAFLLGVSCLTAFNVTDISGWFGLHVLTVGLALTAWLLLVAAELTYDLVKTLPAPLHWLRIPFELGNNWPSWCGRLAAIAGVFTAVLSVRVLGHALETSEWWSIGPLLAITALFATLNWQTQRRRYLYVAAALFNLAVSIWWISIPVKSFFIRDFLLVNVMAASLSGILWLWLELRARQRKPDLNPKVALHHLVAILSIGVLLLIVIAGFEIRGERPQLLDTAYFATLLLLIACLWDRHAKYAVAGLYLLGLGGGALALQHFELSPTRFAWSATIILAVYTILATLLWHWRGRVIALAERFGVPARISVDNRELAWLSVFTGVAVASVAVLSYSINIAFLDLELRVSAAIALAAQFLAFGLLAEGGHARRWRRASVAVFVIGAILIGWSWLTPGVDATWLNRSVILMLITFGLTALYGSLLDRANAHWPEWTNSTRACVPWLIGAGVVALFFCLATEVRYQLDFGAVLIHPLSLTAIGFTLAAAVVICVLFALSPTHDPLNLSERGRMRYVYVAEVMLALLFLHVRLTMPWLFTGFIERYWPLVVMLIAYFGVVTSESLRRRSLLVLAQPLERTGAFLPLLPVLGFWLASSEVDFSLLLFLVGGLYGLLSILRRSFAFGLLAALAGNGGLWYMWHRTNDYQFLQHPQLWLIPVALSVLLAAYLNEDKLSEEQLTGIRYFSLVTVYVSSTADIFINGAANSPWLPLILGSFSLVGVFSGIMFRIRGLLLLGSIFLLLSIVTMIWYASVNFGWTWLWYVAGIVTGATIIFMFALFEKKRGEVLRVVEGLKDWEK